MACKDCYHYEKCYFEALRTAHLTGRDYREIVCIDNQISCKFFKDKSLIVELPCKAGKEIYVLNRENIPQRMILDVIVRKKIIYVWLCVTIKSTAFVRIVLRITARILVKKFFLQKKKQKKG